MAFTLSNYIKKVVSLYNSEFLLLKSKQEIPIYRVLKFPDATDARLHFQIVGTSNTLKVIPEKIMRDNLLLGFSRSEIAMIAHLGTKNEIMNTLPKKPNRLFKILKQIFSKGTTFFLVEKDTGEVLQCAAHELYCDDAIANCFLGKEAIQIGYAAAEDHYKRNAKLTGSV